LENINEHGSYIMNISSDPCSFEKTPESIAISNLATHKISNPLMLPEYLKKVVVGAFYRSRWLES
jgi:hypothetical protein